MLGLTGIRRSALLVRPLLRPLSPFVALRSVVAFPVLPPQIPQSSRTLQWALPMTRSFSTAIPTLYRGRFDPPRFNTGPSNGLFSMIPDAFKTGLAVVGGCAFLMIFGPFFFIVMPPLFVFGFFYMRRQLGRRSRGMSHRWDLLRQSTLEYQGSELDGEQLERWAQQRVAIAFEKDEKDILSVMGMEQTRHDYGSRLVLTGPESIDQDIRMNNRMDQAQRIAVITYGLVDKDSGSGINKVGTVTVSLQPQTVTTLLNIQRATQKAIIEVKPLLRFRREVVLDTADSYADQPVINVRAKRTSRR